MQIFQGTLQSAVTGESPLTVSVQFDGSRVRMWSDRNRIGSWEADEVRVQRETIFRFLITIGNESYRFSPEDPSGFADHTDLEIDLTADEKPRFGLAERIRAAQVD